MRLKERKITRFYHNDTIIRRFVTNFISDSLIVEIKSFEDGDDSSYFYFDDGLKIKEIDFPNDTTFYKYDKDLYLTDEIFRNGGFEQHHKFWYDENGNKIKSFFDMDNGYYTFYEYDDCNRLVREQRGRGIFPVVVEYKYE